MSNIQPLNPFSMGQSPAAPTGNAVAQADQQRAIAEVQAAMVIARMNPRDPVAAMDRILNACARPKLAETALYQYSRGGTTVSGPSIRLTEAIAQQWGNMQFGIRELEQRSDESTVQAFAWDVETNTKREMTFQVPHTRDNGVRLTKPRDIYEQVANQGARRLRACILAVIPGDVVEAAVQQCELTLKTNVDTSPDAIKKMADAFHGFGISQAQLEKRLQRRIEAIHPAQMVSLRKIYTSLKDGVSSTRDWFEGSAPADPASAPASDAGSRTEALRKALKPAAQDTTQDQAHH